MRSSRRLWLVPPALLALYPLAGLIGGTIPANRGWTAPAHGVTLFIESNGIPTGIIMPKVAAGVDWRGVFPPGDLADPRPARDLAAGVGLTATSSVYQTRQKHFSTSFNFGTHLAIGRSFGERREHEVSLRIEHFSNAGIKHPNPGENFVQLRYARRF